MLVKEISKCASVERSGSGACGPDPDAFQVQDLVVELEIDPVLRTPGDHESEATEQAWKRTVEEISFYMARSTSVVVRGCTPQLRIRFSKASLALHFGNLGQRCQWIEGTLYAAEQDDSETTIPIHMITSMEEFIDMVEDTSSCGNYLDGKDMNPCPPFWATPLFHSTDAWNHSMHLRFSQQARKKIQQPVKIEPGGPRVIRSPTWSSQGWRLATHPGFVTFPHHDCCGMCTYVVGNAGCKLWAVMRPKRKDCPSSLQGLVEAFQRATTTSEEGAYPDADIATVCLEEGDVMYVDLLLFYFIYFL